MSLVKAIRSFSRLRQIADILFRYGFSEVIDELRFRSHLPFEKPKQRPTRKEPPEYRLRKAMEEAGGAFVKLGQMLSLRPDLIPEDFCREFEKLQDQVKPVEYAKIKKVVEEELNKPLHKIFRSFEKQPIASASIGQVHKAQLHTGQWVAVKVQKPHIDQTFLSDIDILSYLAEQAEKHSEALKFLQPRTIVKQFEEYTKRELDFVQEGKNIDIFFRRYQHNPNIKVPMVHWDYTTKRVLTMNFVNGRKISTALQTLTQAEKRSISLLVTRSFLDQIFEMHIFHADPHPGNILYTNDKKVCLLDYGIVGRMSPQVSEAVELLIVGLVKGDLDIITESFIAMGVLEGSVDEDKFKQDLFDAWASYHNVDLKKINMRAFFSDTFSVARKHKIQYPDSFVLLTKSFITLEALTRKLYPEANFIEVCESRVRRALENRRSPSHITSEAKKSFFRFGQTFKRIPEDLRTIMYIIRHGATVKVDVDSKDLQYYTRELDRSSNRLTYGIIMGCLIIAAGLLTIAQVQPLWRGIPLFAWVAIIIALMLGFALMISVFHDHRQKGETE